MGPASSGNQPPIKRRSSLTAPARIQALDHDILSSIFSSLNLFDVARCSAVCKSWNKIIHGSNLFQVLYCRKIWGSTDTSTMPSFSYDWESLKFKLQELAMEDHSVSLQEGRIYINQWRGHSVGVNQCRMKRGYVLTGVGDKVMRLWSLQSYKCVEEYSIPDTIPIVDFDFDESKIVGLVGNRLCIWRRNGKRSIFPQNESTYSKGLCMRYVDPEAVVGCEDGTARVFDMYNRKCSRIIRMHAGSTTCLCLSEDHCIISGSSLGSITVSSLSSNQQVATLKPADFTGIETLCYNPCSHLVFAGSTSGYASCWDLRKMRMLWKIRASSNVVYSMQHLQNDTSTLVVGGIDGIVRIMSQSTGEVLSKCVMDDEMMSNPRGKTDRVIERRRGRRIGNDIQIDSIPRRNRPPITCLAVGMKKVVTTHNGKYIRMWKFRK